MLSKSVGGPEINKKYFRHRSVNGGISPCVSNVTVSGIPVSRISAPHMRPASCLHPACPKLAGSQGTSTHHNTNGNTIFGYANPLIALQNKEIEDSGRPPLPRASLQPPASQVPLKFTDARTKRLAKLRLYTAATTLGNAATRTFVTMSDKTPPDAAPPATHGRSIVFLGLNRSPPFVTESTRLPVRLIPGQVLVKVELATICGSDLHTLNGTRTAAQPCVLGHEGSGVVVASGRDDVREGQRVTWGVCASCHKCLQCSIGMENKCKSVLKQCGHAIMSAAPLFGTYSTHALCPPGTPVVPLPPTLTPTLAAPLNCALATMVNALSKLPPAPPPGKPGACVALVQGAGMLGVYATALLREAGFSKVLCVDVNRVRLTRVAEFGATPVVSQGVRALRDGGTYVLVGLVCPTDCRLQASTLIMKCLTVVGVHNYSARHLRQAVTFLERHHHRYPFDTLVGPVYPLSDFRSAVDAARSGQFFRVGINPQQ
ncbi:5-exo-hydroxycamphor dehydrogenase [Chionoecetes opilio]|uniref:5-exo-hydroxycamphor dehydrogenase n=1 Tax=Chionoecetes opilio TaxID=41210 RepID=A0A8J5CLX4_CHIOP|nr:5-exo-hydroxycamphor dehydrogenase [Chionoecetes opilio]